MTFSVIANDLELVESGVLHLKLNDSCGNINMNYQGLDVSIIIKALESEEYKDVKKTIIVTVSDKSIEFTHCVEKKQSGNESGLLAPTKIGDKSDGGKIFIAWVARFMRTNNGSDVVIVTFSLYEGHDD
ncbi:hypothetical protein WCU37_13975 [Serratia marcescens]|uniref:hypothetical protein n=1 Tax=Serratia marcescens TaxID=615 RepID=UPI0030D57F0F